MVSGILNYMVTEDQSFINDIQRSLGRVEGKLDSINYALNAHVTADQVMFTAHEKKLDKHTEDIIAMKTKASIFGAVAGIVTTLIAQFLFRMLFQ